MSLVTGQRARVPVVLLKLGHGLQPGMMRDRAGSSALPFHGPRAVLARASGSVVGVEERRDTGLAPRGRGTAPQKPEAADRLDRSDYARADKIVETPLPAQGRI